MEVSNMHLVPLTVCKKISINERNNKMKIKLVIHIVIAILQIIAILLGFLLL